MLNPSAIIKRVPFSPRDKEHRQALYDFIKTGKWSTHFEIPQGCKNLPYTLMETVLIHFDKCENVQTK